MHPGREIALDWLSLNHAILHHPQCINLLISRGITLISIVPVHVTIPLQYYSCIDQPYSCSGYKTGTGEEHTDCVPNSQQSSELIEG